MADLSPTEVPQFLKGSLPFQQIPASVPPPGWTRPDWLEDEPEPPGLPLTKGRMRWLLHVLGWGGQELSRRTGINENSLRKMLFGKRTAPDPLAIWLEASAAHALAGPNKPEGWRTPGAPELLQDD